MLHPAPVNCARMECLLLHFSVREPTSCWKTSLTDPLNEDAKDRPMYRCPPLIKNNYEYGMMQRSPSVAFINIFISTLCKCCPSPAPGASSATREDLTFSRRTFHFSFLFLFRGHHQPVSLAGGTIWAVDNPEEGIVGETKPTSRFAHLSNIIISLNTVIGT